MIFSLNIFIYSFITTLFIGCKVAHPRVVSEESVEIVSTFWKTNNIDSPHITLTEKAWFKDSIGISEICRINFVETDTSQSIYISTIGFRFLDMKKKWAYEYLTFSDTASINRKYLYNDTTSFSGGWNFVNRTNLGLETLTPLPDTTINAIIHKRYKASLNFKNGMQEAICWFRCDKKNTVFEIYKPVSNKVGCPLVFFRTYPLGKPNSKHDKELRFISNNLPDSVQRVFSAWKKNEIKHPVQ